MLLSILRDGFDTGRSDVDILVEFDPSVGGSFTMNNLHKIAPDIADSIPHSRAII